MTNRIIGFAGRKRSGKTTLAKSLRDNRDAIIITIADYLKRLCCELMNITYEELIEKKDNGTTFDITPTEKWYEIINKHTNISVENIRKELEGVHITSIRQLLQVIGTDVIRKYDENWHVNKMIEEIETQSEDKLIVIDDVRFPNEREAILNHSGRVFFIIRGNVSEVSNHPSEIALKWQDFNIEDIILNTIKYNEEKFKNEFIQHYDSDFTFYKTASIFLNENKGYLKCSNFGYNCNIDDELLIDIINQVRNDDRFKKYGLIKYFTYSCEKAKRYISEVDNSYLETSLNKWTDRYNLFTTLNPLITENLKKYL